MVRRAAESTGRARIQAGRSIRLEERTPAGQAHRVAAPERRGWHSLTRTKSLPHPRPDAPTLPFVHQDIVSVQGSSFRIFRRSSWYKSTAFPPRRTSGKDVRLLLVQDPQCRAAEARAWGERSHTRPLLPPSTQALSSSVPAVT